MQATPNRRFAQIESHGSVDYALRTMQQGLLHFSSLADAKANILITVSALIFSIGLTHGLGQTAGLQFRPAVLVLLSGSALALVLAVLCARPGRYRPNPRSEINPLFFLHFAELSRESYFERMDDLLSDPAALTQAIVRDIYDQGVAVAHRKYRFLRWSYHTLIVSIALSLLLAFVELFG
jgi:hypothetical protein